MLIWCDPLYPCGVTEEQKNQLAQAAEGAIQTLKAASRTLETEYALALFETLASE